MALEGLHHVTAITADAQANVDFYAETLGLRLVKKTVNFDAPDVYHLYFGDEAGTPGSILTFFEFPGAARGRPGAGMVHTIRWRVGSDEALGFWAGRLAEARVDVAREDGALRFEDFEGLRHELVAAPVDDAPLAARAADIAPEHALLGFHGVRAYAQAPARSAPLLEALGFTREGDGDADWRGRGAGRHRPLPHEPPPARRGRPRARRRHPTPRAGGGAGARRPAPRGTRVHARGRRRRGRAGRRRRAPRPPDVRAAAGRTRPHERRDRSPHRVVGGRRRRAAHLPRARRRGRRPGHRDHRPPVLPLGVLPPAERDPLRARLARHRLRRRRAARVARRGAEAAAAVRAVPRRARAPADAAAQPAGAGGVVS